MALVLIFLYMDCDAHAAPGFDAFHGAFQPQRMLHGQACAKASAHPQDIFGFDEHSAGADVTSSRAQPCRTPFDLENGPVRKARRPPPLHPASPQFGRVHGLRTLRVQVGAQESSPCSVPLLKGYDGRSYVVSDTARECFVPANCALGTRFGFCADFTVDAPHRSPLAGACRTLYFQKNERYISNAAMPLVWTQANQALALYLMENSVGEKS